MRLSVINICFLILFVFTQQTFGQVYTNKAEEYFHGAAMQKDTAIINNLLRKTVLPANIHKDSVLNGLIQALSISKRIRYTEGTIKSLYAMGRFHSMDGHYKEGLEFFKETLPFYNVLNSKEKFKIYTNVFNSIGSGYQSLGDFRRAGEFYIRAAQEASKDTSLNSLRAFIYSNIGGVFMQLHEHKKAINYFKTAETLALEAKDFAVLAHVLGNKGIYYEENNDFDSAKFCYTTALNLSEKYNNQRVRLTALSNLGALYMKQEQYKIAIPYFEKALRLSPKEDIYLRLNGPLYFLGSAYYYLGDFKKAEKYLLITLKEANAFKQPEMNTDAHAMLALVYAASGDYKKAYVHQKNYEHMKDSLSGIDAIHNVNILETKYRTAQKDKQIIQKQLQITKQQVNIQRKTTWIWISTTSGLLLLTLLGMLFRNYNHKQKLHRERLRTMQQEKEIELLQAMMKGEEKERIRMAHELHDGISSQVSAMMAYLLAIRNQHYDLARNNDFQQVINMLNETACDIRKTAHNLMPDSLIRQGLVSATQHFCEQINYSKTINIEFQPYGYFDDLPGNLSLFIYRMIQELLNNIIKHAQATQAIILFYKEKNKFLITVEDNGIGMPVLKKKKTGMGLSSLEAKIRSMQGVFSLESKQGQGTTIYIELDLQNEKKIMTHEDTNSNY